MEQRKIFINYRREDSAGYAGRLYDRLRARFADQVFMDVGGIEVGADFVAAIEREVGSCGVCLVVIGRAWLNASDPSGRRRLDDPNDFVRLEIAIALRRDVTIIPVLVGGAQMPSESDLPADLQSLARRNALLVSDQDWDHHVMRLIRVIESSLQLPAPAPKSALATLRNWLRTRPLRLTISIAALLLLVRWETPRLCRGGSRSLTNPGVHRGNS